MNINPFRLPQASLKAPTLWAQLLCVVVLSWVPGASAQSAEAPPEQPTEQPTEQALDGVEQLDGIQRSLNGPDVVITAGKQRTVYEYRQNGQLRLVKIVPRLGRPYYLVPADQTRGFGDLNQANTLLPQWTIIEF